LCSWWLWIWDERKGLEKQKRPGRAIASGLYHGPDRACSGSISNYVTESKRMFWYFGVIVENSMICSGDFYRLVFYIP